eukprot:m.40600 g.40600  ORF g.40600 m.40600 type:complete len:362 (+) comp12762_c0_seq1:15-1100(+)
MRILVKMATRQTSSNVARAFASPSEEVSPLDDDQLLAPFLLEEGMLVKNLKASKLKRIANNFVAKAGVASSTSASRIRHHELSRSDTRPGDDFLFLEVAKDQPMKQHPASSVSSAHGPRQDPTSVAAWIHNRQAIGRAQAEGDDVLTFLACKPRQAAEQAYYLAGRPSDTVLHTGRSGALEVDRRQPVSKPTDGKRSAPPAHRSNAMLSYAQAAVAIRSFIASNRWRLHSLFGRLKRGEDDYCMRMEDVVSWLAMVSRIDATSKDAKLLLGLIESPFQGELQQVARFHLQRFVASCGVNSQNQVDFRAVVDDYAGMHEAEHRRRCDNVQRRRRGLIPQTDAAIHQELARKQPARADIKSSM